MFKLDLNLTIIAKTFEDLIAWQKAKQLGIAIYLKAPKEKDYNFYDQIKRAGLSISNNIAEGFGRKSQKDFKRFLQIALGSTNEVKSMVLLGKEIGVIEPNLAKELEQMATEVTKILIGLSSKIKTD